MKKLLLLTVALTSFMAHAMEPTYAEATAGRPAEEEKQAIYIPIPNPLIAQTSLGEISRLRVNEAIVLYNLTKNNKATAVLFDTMRQEFRGATHTIAIINGTKKLTNCEPIESQAEVKAQFDKIKAGFDAAPNKTRKFNI